MPSPGRISQSRRGSAAAESVIYLLTLAIGGLAVAQMATGSAGPDWSKFSILLLLGCGATRLRLRLPGLERIVSLAFPFCFAAITELPAIYALGLIAAVEWFEALLEPEQRERSFGEKALDGVFRLAAAAVAVWAASAVYAGLAVGDGLEWAIGSVGAATAYFAVVSSLHSLRIAAAEGSNPVGVWNRVFFWSSPIYLLAPFGVLVSKLLLEAESFLDTAVGLSVIGAAYWYLHIYFPRLYEERDHAQKLVEIRQRALETLVVAIEAKDGSTAGHLQRVKRLAVRLGRELGCSPDELRTLQLAAVLHDVGKVGVPDYILQKPSRLTESEFEEVAAHAGIGADIVSTMDFPEPVDEVVLSHHEHWDGSGYPRRLRGEAIPKLARILTVVDCFDALVSERPYRKPLPIEAAVEMLERQRGKIFDPAILDVFLSLVPQFANDLRRELVEESARSSESAPKRVSVRQTWVEKDDADVSPIAENLQRLGRRPQHLETLHEIMAELGSGLDYDRALCNAMARLRDLTSAESAALFTLRSSDSELSLFLSDGLADDSGPRLSITRDPALVDRALKSSAASVYPGSIGADGVRSSGSCTAVRLALGDEPIGLLVLSSSAEDTFTPEHALLADLLSAKITSTLLASQQLEKLHIEASTDVTTGLPNSRVSFQRLDQEINRAGREGQTLGVLFMDLTGLKPVNDSYGHIAGDRLLAATADKLKRSLRSYDFVGRVGGDEFLALLPGVSAENLDQMIANIKRALAESPVEVAPDKVLRPVLSIGGALYPDDAVSAKELLDISDQRMYADKERGLALSPERPTMVRAASQTP